MFWQNKIASFDAIKSTNVGSEGAVWINFYLNLWCKFSMVLNLLYTLTLRIEIVKGQNAETGNTKRYCSLPTFDDCEKWRNLNFLYVDK